MGLNPSNRQIAQELDLDKDVVQNMTTQLREGIDQSKPEVNLSGSVECDEVCVTAGHKGKPEEVKKKVAKEDGIGSKGLGGGETLEKEKPPILGMIQRGGEVVIRKMLDSLPSGISADDKPARL